MTEKVTSEDFKDHYSVGGVFGAYQYFGKDYQPNEITEENSDIQSKHCVIYTVTPYPDYSSDNGKFDTVTRIEITDPQVSVYGITCNSALQDFDKTFENLGCTIRDEGLIHIAAYGKVEVSLASYDEFKRLTVSVEVTNKQGVIF